MVKPAVQKKQSEAGQAVVLVIAAMSIFLLGAVGLAVDGSHLYAQRQAAQAAADASAVAGIMGIFDGTYTGKNALGSSPYYCDSGDSTTPCIYTTKNGFSGVLSGGSCTSAGDCVYVERDPADVTVPNLDPGTPNRLRVTVTRPVSMTLTKFVGLSSFNVSAQAVAAIVDVMSPVPILVTHPTLPSALETKGTGSSAKITICGGPQRSIQVNSKNTASLAASGGGVINLSQASPPCGAAGTGTDFGDFGGPRSAPFTLQLGSTGHFTQPASPILDPFWPSGAATCTSAACVHPPSAPTVNGVLPASGTPLAAGSNGCPVASGGCTLVFPGNFTSRLQAKNNNIVFAPGIYYMNGVDFTAAANGNMYYATGMRDTGTGQTIANCCGTSTGWGGAGNTPANSGIMVYMTGSGTTSVSTGTISISSNSNVSLIGSPNGSSYKGMLFFVDRNAAANTHSLDGGGGLTLVGTIYMPGLLSTMKTTSSQYQLLHFQGNAGSNTHITGEIITSALLLEGTPAIVMNLDPNATAPVRQVALVQ